MMQFLKRLLGLKEQGKTPPEESLVETEEMRAANTVLADDPICFAEWVLRYTLEVIDPDSDLELCPSEEQCQRLEITLEQREACRREFSVMRALGACMFVGRNLSPTYYAAFKREICAAAAGLLYGVPTESRIQEVSTAIDKYFEDLGEKSSTAFSLTYLDRVYAGNANQTGMFAVGLFQIPLQVAMAVFEAVRDGYCQLKFSLPFKALEALEKTADEKGR